MILKRIITAYWAIGILLYVSFTAVLIKNPDFLLMHSMSLGTFLVFAISVTASYKKRKRFFTSQNLFFTVFACLVIEATFFQMASWMLAKYDYRRMKRQLLTIAIYGWFILVAMVCLVWNLRY